MFSKKAKNQTSDQDKDGAPNNRKMFNFIDRIKENATKVVKDKVTTMEKKKKKSPTKTQEQIDKELTEKNKEHFVIAYDDSDEEESYVAKADNDGVTSPSGVGSGDAQEPPDTAQKLISPDKTQQSLQGEVMSSDSEDAEDDNSHDSQIDSKTKDNSGSKI